MITITVQYMTAPKFEVSSGVMVPTTPFHSYAAAASSADASKTVVQQSLTYTVVPTANVNFLIKEFMTRQRAALFETTAVGYNPATSAVRNTMYGTALNSHEALSGITMPLRSSLYKSR